MPLLTGVRGVKLPVTDIERSIEWYRDVFGFEVEWEFPDTDGVVRGVAGWVEGQKAGLALRHNPEVAKGIAGFDPVIWSVGDQEDIRKWMAHLDDLGVPHSPMIEASVGWLLVFNDPDGIEIHLYTDAGHGKDLGDRPGYGRRVASARGSTLGSAQK